MRWPSITPSAPRRPFCLGGGHHARAKGELFESLPAGVTACVNLDDAYAGLWQTLAGDARQIGFGWSQGEVRHRLPTAQRPRGHDPGHAAGADCRRDSRAGRACGAQRLTAVSPAVALGVSASAIAQGLSQFAGAPGRLQRKLRADGVLVLDVHTHQRQTPMRAALRACWRRSRRTPRRAGRYRRVGDGGSGRTPKWALCPELGIDSLHGLGELSAHTVAAFGSGGQHIADLDALLAGLAPLLHRRRRCW